MTKRNKANMPKVFAFILILTFIFSALHFHWTIVDRIAFGVQDIKFTVRKDTALQPTPLKKTIIVTVDEKSVNEHGRWPWDRSIIATLFENMHQANIIGLDILFSEYTNPESDMALAEAIEENDNIILGFFLRDEATRDNPDYELDMLDDSAIHRYQTLTDMIKIREFKFAESNITEVAESALASAFFTTESDTDGLFREYPLVYMFDGNIFPSLAIQVIRYHLNKDVQLELGQDGVHKLTIGDIEIKNTNRLKLNFYDDVTYVSATDVISGKVKPSYFKDKIVIVGVTEVGVYDLRPTPMDTITPGVSLHLTAISNLLQGHYLKEVPNLDFALILASVILTFSIMVLKNLYIRILSYAVVVTSLMMLSYGLFMQNNIWLNEFYPLLAIVLSAITLEILAFVSTEAKSAEVKKAFSAYVSPEVVNIMTKDPDKLKLGGEERDISVIFADIRGFTSLSEMLTSEQIVYILNKLNDPLTEAILKNEGLLDKYIGDAIMALFNTPIDIEHHADKACLSALEMVDILHVINGELAEEGFPVVDIGIGINSGPATVGNMGSKIRFDYTAIGDTVNLSSRLEGLNKVYKTRIIISENTLKKLETSFVTRKLDIVRVKGKHIPISIFEVMKDSEQHKKIKLEFDIAFDQYLNQSFTDAASGFKKIHDEFNDLTSEMFYERCQRYIEIPPGKDWDGVFTLTSK